MSEVTAVARLSCALGMEYSSYRQCPACQPAAYTTSNNKINASENQSSRAPDDYYATANK
eukprot:1161798-Pelagomonas_calceolata.AAC.11